MSNELKTQLSNAIDKEICRCVDSIERALEAMERGNLDESLARRAQGELRLLRELSHCARRFVRLEGVTIRDIHTAYGAPGDFGYETPIGQALSNLYSGKES